MKKQFSDFKFKKTDYMNNSEKVHFKELLNTGSVTFFRLSYCENCNAEIPNTKKYCSFDCKVEIEGEEENESW